ncbi:DNA-3-methyladenine glycosylase family protein [Candidatus Raskinella chloraquaticus]|uniref:DNA-3-methyladenine glycosylase II n=1 Tax=Candidatus Raskinella chloraquaticus TaxID=1951219 RepID=A0A1W9HSB0_9HYPH|nr:MAG: hypothetical protein A4S15_00675 [Proteobacteria bacterium SG_bin8]
MSTRIDSDEDIASGLAWLMTRDPVFAEMSALAGPLPLRRSAGGFAGLAGIVIAQQLSVKAANAIEARVEALVPGLDPKRFALKREATLRAAGLSAAKVKTLKAAAKAMVKGELDHDVLLTLDSDGVREKLTALPGIGPWTADIYCLFCLGHGDAFAAGDLALQEAVRIAYALDSRPKEKALLAMAEAWRPWRGVAARLLWAYYRVVKMREGVTG